jgi:hypothetical protein
MRLQCLLLFMSPVAIAANTATAPELGVAFTSFTSDIVIPKPVELPDGIRIQIRLGSGWLSVTRYDDPSRGSRQIADPNYQKELRQDKERMGIRVSSAQLTKIDGHDTFVILGTQTPAPGAPIAAYHCFASVVVDHQLISIEVFAIGKPSRPPEFETGLKILAGMQFIPVDLSSLPVPELVASSPTKMPRFLPGEGAFYPDYARRYRRQGVVDLSFRIDELGHAQDIKQLFAAFPELGASSLSHLKSGRFKVPADWVTTNSEAKIFTIEFQYMIVDRPSAVCSKADPKIEGAEAVGICANAI